MATRQRRFGLEGGTWARTEERCAGAVAISLPWSTSATGILMVLWLLALLPALRVAGLREVIATPAGALPLVLVLASGLPGGVLWAAVCRTPRAFWRGYNLFPRPSSSPPASLRGANLYPRSIPMPRCLGRHRQEGHRV